MAYRYAIGRHSYAGTYASDMGKAMYDIMNADERRRAALDIRSEIADHLRMMPFNFIFDRTIPRDARKPYEMLCDFLNAHPEIDLTKTTQIECFINPKTNELCYAISVADATRCERKIYQYEVDVYALWADLASLMDEDSHVMVEFKGVGGEIRKVKCFPSYINDAKVSSVDKNGIITLETIDWRYKLVYRPVEYGVSNRFIDSDSIVRIKHITKN